MNRKGFTTVELIVSFSLTSVIVLLLFQLVFVLKDMYVDSGIKVKLITKQATINSSINEDFANKKIRIAKKISDTSVEFIFFDGTSRTLSYDREKKAITYGNFATNLIAGSEFGNITIKTEYGTFVDSDDFETLNGVLSIKIPVYHSLFEKEDFGVNIMHLYNSNITSLSGLNLTDVVDAKKQILLTNEETIAFQGVSFTEPGYYVVNTQTGDSTLNDPSVQITGSVSTNQIGIYYLTYTLYDMNNNIMDQKVRTVNVISSEKEFSYTGERQTFNVPVNGTYKIEMWGASGGGSNLMSGKGGYTVSEYALTTEDELYIYVGGKGTLSTASAKALGGFNGGGDSGSSTANFAGSGGGATDIRLNNDTLAARILVAGGGGGAGSRNDSTTICTGGIGGGTLAGIGTCSATSYLGGAGTATSGGAAATYTTNITTVATAGSNGIGGTGASYASGSTTYAAGGGGGGYYGGGGGSRYGGGGGGSGYCSNTVCTTYAGDESIPKKDNSGYQIGHTGDGFVRITLISIS